MKQFLYSILFAFLMVPSAVLNAQSFREPLSLQQKSDDGVLVAYPNPAKDFIILKTKNPKVKVKNVTFYSIIGVEVANVSLNSNYAEVRLDGLKPGKYLMRYLLSDNTQKVTQIIKQ